MEIFKIHPLVWVFNNAIENPQEIIDFYENNSGWEKWYTFGKMRAIDVESSFFPQFPNIDEWNEQVAKPTIYSTPEQSIFAKKITDAFYKTTKMFWEGNNIKTNDISFFSFNIAKYVTGGRMNYHTDYRQERFLIPEIKFHTTAVFYLNDNYIGGEISFIELDDEQNILWSYDYKPKAGDVVVFSSNEPIYHGVNTIESGEKYMIRTYLRFNQPPTPEWEQGVLQYGEKEWWKKQEEEALERRTSMLVKTFNSKDFHIQYVDKKLND